MLIFCLLINLSAAQFTTIPALFSKHTSPLIVSYFKETLECSLNYTSGCNLGLPFLYSVYEIDDFFDLDQIFTFDSNYLFVYDGTWSISMSTLISQYAMTYGFIHFIIDYSPEKPLPYVYYSFYSLNTHAQSALAIAKAYSIKRVICVISSEFIKIDFNTDEEVEVVAQFVLTELVTYDYVYWLFSKKIKPLGVKWLFFKTNTRISKLIQEAIVAADMDREGYTFLYIEEAAWGAYLEGSILLEEKWFHSTDYYSYTYQLVVLGTALYYGVMESTNIQGSYSAYEIYNLVSRQISPEAAGFTIWNIQSPGKFTAVGFFNNKGLSIYAPIKFPGGTYNLPNNDKIKIPFSINREDSKSEKWNYINQLGAIFAIDTINKNGNLLPNFYAAINSIEHCVFSANSSGTCFLNHTDDLGYFHISPTESSTTLQTIEAFQALNISTPIIGVETSTQTSDLKYYPQYARVSYPNSRTASASALILSVFGISKCSLLYSDSIWGQDFSQQFENQTESYGIKILNKNRAIPLGYDGTDTKSIKEIIDAKSRYVVLEVQQPDVFYLIEAFYKLGMREGDIYLIVGDGMISVPDLDKNKIGSDAYNRRKEIMSGLIYISFLAFENQVGIDIENSFISTYGYAYDFMCLFYDTVYLGFQTISALLERGINLDSDNIQKIVRDVKFTGCSGVVRVSQDGNDRLSVSLGIYNLVQINSTWTMNLCGLYDPSQLIVLQINQQFSWTAKGQIPSDIIGDDQECPFRSIQVKTFEYGYLIMVIVEIVPFIIGISLMLKFYNFIFIQKFPKLINAEKENFLDLISYVIMLIESLQYMQIGPDFTVFFYQWSNITKLASLDISGLFKKGFFTFWNQVQLVYSLSLGWCIFFALKLLIADNDFQVVNQLNLWFLPIAGDILFLPINLYLFQSFQCTNAIGNNFKDSFLDQYCSTFCWQGEHIYYVIISSVTICLYTPASLYFRFTWKDKYPFHFKEQRLHYALKSFVQMALIVLYTIVKPVSEDAFLGLGIGLLLAYIAITILRQPFTYHRASLWYVIFLTSSLLIWICCALAKLNKIAALAVLVTGWMIFAIVGAIYQKLYLPSLLESLKGQDIHKLFRFQLFSISPEEAGISKAVKYEYAHRIIQPNNNEGKYTPGIIESSAVDEDNLKSSLQSLEVLI